MNDIRKWNPELKGDVIREGEYLRIYARTPQRPLKKMTYVVKKGDTLGAVSKKLKVPVKELMKINKLKVGDELVYYSHSVVEKSSSIGSCASGRLENGEMMPSGKGFSTSGRANIFGTNETVANILKCLKKFRSKYPKAPPVLIGDLSKKGGGELPPHVSHQSGRDVDIGYAPKDGKHLDWFKDFKPSEIDMDKSWFLIKCFLEMKDTQMIFMDYPLQEHFYNFLKKKKVSKKLLRKYFQFPGGPDADIGMIRHSKGHYSHFHVRFKCAKGDKGCVK
ncbi:MAG: penicillin-insensitive murein endopeptidase [Deltaproteobacteria bacterium]|nr:penicillin-insensitive murein endopeptidase [Deltaproteobacteria bacterium]